MRSQKLAERIHEAKNDPPRAQSSCEAWRLKQTRVPGDKNRATMQRGRAVRLREMEFSCDLRCCV